MSADDLITRLERMQKQQMTKKQVIDDKRKQLRSEMPTVAAFVDQVRCVFGQGVRVVYAEENMRCVGKRSR
jgi:hypothetical protein